ncbi:MAG: phosphate ABC transporter substrate-binding protein PstS [Actinomycetota bacterium]|nr:phosphate ABC transporter substrate-binding protein PstS [Actinomycetota bacterium]
MRSRLVAVCVPALALGLIAAGCGSDNNTTKSTASGPSTTAVGAGDNATLSGAGSTFVATILQEWIKQYKAAAPGVTLNYQSVGSGAGIQQLTAKTVDFAGSDVVLKPEEQATLGGADATQEIPWVAGGIAVEYNLPSVKNLKLSPDALAGIFAGKVTKWDDPAIKADNPGVPSTGIQVVHRSDGSGTTQVFTEYLKTVSPSIWTVGSGKDVQWPAGTGAKGSDNVTAAVKQSEGAIGYAEVSYPKQASLGIATVKNKAGQFTSPTATAVTAALASATINPDLTLKLNYTPESPDAYAISTTTYVMFPKAGPDPAKTTALKHFVEWVLTEGQKAAEGLDYAPMPPAILATGINTVKT